MRKNEMIYSEAETRGGVPLEQEAEQQFRERVIPGLDLYFPKLSAFTVEVLDTIKNSDKAAVFVGRDGRWLFYLAKLLASREKIDTGKIKFVDISSVYVNSHHAEGSREYADYFKKLSINPSDSFFVDVGIHGSIISDLREATNTKSDKDILLVEEKTKSSVRGFYKTERPGYDGDENAKLALFMEDLPQVVESIEELDFVKGGRVPSYHNKRNPEKTKLAQMTYGYMKESVEALR